MTELEDWKARALKAEAALAPFERVRAHLPANIEVVYLTATSPPRADPGRFYRLPASAFWQAGTLSASRGEVDGWRPSREAIIAALRGVDGLSGHFVPSDRGARYDIYASVVLDLLSALPPLDEGKGKEAALVSSERTGTPAPPTPGAGLAGKGAP